jgi:hypothetical protein
VTSYRTRSGRRLGFPGPDTRAWAAGEFTLAPAAATHLHLAGAGLLTIAAASLAPAGAFHTHAAGVGLLTLDAPDLFPASAFHTHAAGAGALTSNDVPFSAVDARGGVLTMLTAPTTTRPGTSFPVTRQGYTSTGTTTSFVETLTVATRAYQIWPTTSSQSSYQYGGVSACPSDSLFNTDTAGAATNSADSAPPKPVFKWSMLHQTVVGNSITCRAVVAHMAALDGKQVAAVKFTATDGTTTVEGIASTMTSWQCPRSGEWVTGYEATLDITTLSASTSTNFVVVNALAYPRIGASGSIWNTATDGTFDNQNGTVYFYKDTARAATPFYVSIAATGGNDTTGAVDTNPATADATPCATYNGAMNRLVAVQGFVDGCVIRLLSGVNTIASGTTPAKTTRGFAVWVEPSASTGRQTINLTTTFRPRLTATPQSPLTYQAFGFRRIDFNRTGGSIAGSTGEPTLFLWDDCDWDHVNTGTIINNTAATMLVAHNSEITMNTSGGMAEVANSLYHFHGCNIVSASGSQVPGRTLIGCDITRPSLFQKLSTNTWDGAMMAFCTVIDPTSASIWSIDANSAGQSVTNIALLQNLWEPLRSGIDVLIALCVGGLGNLRHAVIHHNTFVGYQAKGTLNIAYDETNGQQRNHRWVSFVGNIAPRTAAKGDTYVGSTAGYANPETYIGHYLWANGVDQRDNWHTWLTNFPKAYVGVNSTVPADSSTFGDPSYVNYQAVTTVDGAGGGDYRLAGGSAVPAITRICLPRDADNAARVVGTSRIGRWV